MVMVNKPIIKNIQLGQLFVHPDKSITCGSVLPERMDENRVLLADSNIACLETTRMNQSNISLTWAELADMVYLVRPGC